MNLSQCHDLTDISVIAECYHDLIDLDSSYCEDITDIISFYLLWSFIADY
jgi:hypothetical protein